MSAIVVPILVEAAGRGRPPSFPPTNPHHEAATTSTSKPSPTSQRLLLFIGGTPGSDYFTFVPKVIFPVIIRAVSQGSARSSNILLVFAKKPVPGTVKTRLARDVGHAQAARLYRLMAETTWSRTAGPGYERWLVFEPGSERDWMRDWLPGAHSYLPQVSGDLGTRLSAAFEHAFLTGAKAVAVIGTDSPDVAREDISSAFDLLTAGHQAVIGPSTDGGYWLLALSSFQPHVFEDILWSTGEVAAQTRARMAARGLRFAELRTVRDIDRVDDLESLWKDLKRA